jgi:hypothetical protein
MQRSHANVEPLLPVRRRRPHDGDSDVSNAPHRPSKRPRPAVADNVRLLFIPSRFAMKYPVGFQTQSRRVIGQRNRRRRERLARQPADSSPEQNPSSTALSNGQLFSVVSENV